MRTAHEPSVERPRTSPVAEGSRSLRRDARTHRHSPSPVHRPAQHTMSITIAGTEFANHSYDERGDVLHVDVEGMTAAAFRRTQTQRPKATGSSGMQTGA